MPRHTPLICTTFGVTRTIVLGELARTPGHRMPIYAWDIQVCRYRPQTPHNLTWMVLFCADRPSCEADAVKRLTGLETILQQARRGLDPLSGRLLERPPGFDPRLLPDPTTPIAPWVEQLIVTTVNEAIALNLPLFDALERLTTTLEQSGIILTVDDLQWLLGFNLGDLTPTPMAS